MGGSKSKLEEFKPRALGKQFTNLGDEENVENPSSSLNVCLKGNTYFFSICWIRFFLLFLFLLRPTDLAGDSYATHHPFCIAAKTTLLQIIFC